MESVNWTKQQLQAIKEDRNNILVAAAAGSGKTAVLVERIIDKILNKNIDIDKILVVTFTNAAASEMRERILDAINKKIEENPENEKLSKQITLLSKASICTIDSFCLDIVKNNFYELGISPNFRIADTTELELLKQETIEDLFEEKYETNDKKFLKLLETYSTYLSDEKLKEIVLSIDKFIQSSPFPKDWLEEKVREFNISDKIELDFSNNKWGKIIINNVKDELLDCKVRLEKIYNDLLKFDELKKYLNTIKTDIDVINRILNTNTWDELYNEINCTTFEKWPIDKKIILEEKNIAKEKRDKVKKQFNQAIEVVNCNSKDANLDIYYMYEILCNLKDLVLEFEEQYYKNKAEKNIVDFNDIEHFALQILLEKDENGKYIPTQIAEKYKNKYKEIAIDEYQDSNLVQEYILSSVSNGKNMFMVGDVKQSIYQFRQACPDLFLSKYEEYSILDDNSEDINNLKGIKIQLFKNFRSRENILKTTNLIFDNIMSKKLGNIDYNENEYLNLGANFKQTEGEIFAKNTEINIIENSNSIDDDIIEEPIENIEIEAKFVAKKIKEIIQSNKLVYDKTVGYRPVTYKDIVILLRATKERANIFEKEINNLDMPVFTDTAAEYLQSIEIQTIMSLLKIIDNPMQDIPLVTVLRSSIGNFNDNELIKIRIETGTNKTFYESMKLYYENKNDSLQSKIKVFLEQLRNWQEEEEYLNLDEFIWKLYEDTGYYNYVGLMTNGLLRQSNLRTLFEKAKQYEKASFKGLYNFIHFINQLQISSGDLSSAKLIGENENVIRIMSIHKSKGLEFPIVFLCGSNKKFNMKDLNLPILLHQNLGIGVNLIDSERKLQYTTLSKEAIKIVSKEELISEEMRVLYVALTRAKEQLIITGVSKEIDKELQEKEEILSSYHENKINKNILKKYQSYLDWIELVSLKNKVDKNLKLNIIPKNEIIIEKNEASNTDVDNTNFKKLKEKINDINKENLASLKKELEWEYNYINEGKLEAKTSVSQIKANSNLNEDVIKFNTPKFLKDEIITNSRKGTITHLCMQKLNPKEEYNLEKINSILEELVYKNIITIKEKKAINIQKIYCFTKSIIWEELKSAKLIEREKPFYINLPATQVYNEPLNEEVLVQGIIDLFYINKEGELVLVDYKTDYVEEESLLIQKYKVQLDIYSKALQEVFNRKVDKIYIYSTYLDKEIKIC